MNKFLLKESIEDSALLEMVHPSQKNQLYASYASNYLAKRHIRENSEFELATLMMISERFNVHPQILINEGFWGSVKSFLGLGKDSVQKSNPDPREAEYIADYLETQYGLVDRWKKARSQGASGWQSIKHSFGALGSMFQQGEQVWSKKKAAKLQARAKMAYEDVTGQLSADVLLPMTKDLIKQIKSADLGNPKKGGFPNNPKPGDFRKILIGQESLDGLTSPEKLSGIFGAMLNVKETLQDGIGNGVVAKEDAEKVMEKLVAVLQYYLGTMEDTYQSLENKNIHGKSLIHSHNLDELTKYNRLQFVVEASLMPILLGTDLITEDFVEAQQTMVNKAAEEMQKENPGLVSSDVDPKALTAFLADPKNKEIPDGLDPKKLENMKASVSVVKPLLVALVGAVMAAAGTSMGGSAFGNFTGSPAFKGAMQKLQDNLSSPDGWFKTETWTEAVKEALPLKDGDGATQAYARFKGWAVDENGACPQMMKMSPSELAKTMKEDGVSFPGMKGGTKALFNILGNATGGTVGEVLKGVGGTGSDLAAVFSGGKMEVTKIVTREATKFIKNQVVSTFTGGAATAMLGATATATILATTGTALVLSGVAIAALRKFAKSRKKTMLELVKILEAPFKVPQDAPIQNPEPFEKLGVEPQTGEDEVKTEKPTERFQQSLELVYRALEKKGYNKKEAEEIMELLFDPDGPFPEAREKLTNDKSAQEIMQAHKIIHKSSLVSLLTEEGLPYSDFEELMQKGAEKANVTVPNKKQIANAAVAFNIANGIGDIQELPEEAQESQADQDLVRLAKLIAKMDDEKIELADKLAQEETNHLIDWEEMVSMKKSMRQEIEALQNGKMGMEDMIKAMQEKLDSGEIDYGEALMAAEELEAKLKAVEESSSAQEAELRGEINKLADAFSSASENIDKTGMAMEKLFGVGTLEELFANPDAFVEKVLKKRESDQETVVDDLYEKGLEIAGLQDQLSKANAASSRVKSVKEIFEIMKKFDKMTQGYAKGWDNLSDKKRKKFPKERIPKVQKVMKKEFGVDLEVEDSSVKEESINNQGSLLLERWSKLAGIL
jgi:hypothetical protein